MNQGSSPRRRRSGWIGAGLIGALAAACGSSGNGGGGTAGNTTGTGGACHGDSSVWTVLTQGPIACTQNSDCCVIVNGCLSQSQIVAATNKDQAKAAWPYCDSMCNACIPPAVEVGCQGGTCVGQVVPVPDASTDLLMDHCGAVPVGGTASKLLFSCGG